MKLSFIFTDEPDLKGLSKYEIYQTHFEIPNEALQLPDCEARLLSIAQTVGQLTHATLHINCKELGWKQKKIKVGGKPTKRNETVSWNVYSLVVVFQCLAHRSLSRKIKILAPVDSPFDTRIYRNLGPETIKRNEANTPYLEQVEALRDKILPLLTLDPYFKQWRYLGFSPYLRDNALLTLFNNRGKAQHKEEKKAQREAEKLAKQTEKSLKAAQSKKGRVYFIQQGEDGAIKIGYSTTPEKRLQSLKTANPLPLRILKVIEGGKNLEKELHQRFAAFHIGGEWFQAHPELLDFIDQQPITKNDQ